MKMKCIKKLKIQKSIINLINPNNNKLCALYSRTKALIFPSHDEGLGGQLLKLKPADVLYLPITRILKEIGKCCILF